MTKTGLTTNHASVVENARKNGQPFLEQPYHLYSEANHHTWKRLYARMEPSWQRCANQRFLQGIESLCMNHSRVPRLEEINRFLNPLTGFRAVAVSGYLPAFQFFDCLSRREFPTTITVRDGAHLDYLPEPDIFHDVAGHVPMHTDPAFADTLVQFGRCAHTAAELAESAGSHAERVELLGSIVRALARFFWFTIEFGLMRSEEGLKVYGSGLLSSHGEIEHALFSPQVQRYPLQMEWVINQTFEIDHYQPLLFIVESFDHLYSQINELERWMRAGRLNHTAPGEPLFLERELQGFLPKEKAAHA